MFVEGGARNAGSPDDVGQRGRRITFLGHGFRKGLDDATALRCHQGFARGQVTVFEGRTHRSSDVSRTARNVPTIADGIDTIFEDSRLAGLCSFGKMSDSYPWAGQYDRPSQ